VALSRARKLNSLLHLESISFSKFSNEFMKNIFDLFPGNYLISDESSLYDFTGLDERGLTGIQKKIRDIYDLDISDIEF